VRRAEGSRLGGRGSGAMWRLGRHALVGMHPVIHDGVVVGDGALIGSGRVALSDVEIPPGKMAARVPGKIVDDVPVDPKVAWE
jgi:acetyltransferase-like isoleucine patch superfamily enzyme